MCPLPALRVALTTLALLALPRFAPADAAEPLWDMTALSPPPSATWGPTHNLLQEVYYAGEPLRGQPTRIFAWYAKPEGAGPFPAVVLVHGGGGKAFPDWADHWAKRGYAALAMDLAGHGPSGRLPDGGPDQNDTVKFQDFTPGQAKDMWTYHAVAAVIRGHSLLRSQPQVDPQRVALTGISWGGYLTCIVAGVDHRFQAAVPVYGCGFLDQDSFWTPIFSKMTPDRRQRWVENFDPSRYLGAAQCPMLFVDGTNDFAYPLDSLAKSYNLVKTPVTLAVAINRPHGHIWTFREVDAFIDSHVNHAQPLPTLAKLTTTATTISVSAASPVPLASAQFEYTTDAGPWQKRKWNKLSATITGETVSATLPTERPLVGYLSVTDKRGYTVTTPQVELAVPVNLPKK